MPETVTDIIIEASADDVWRVLSDFPSYSEWNPYIRDMSGTLVIEGTMSVTRVLPDSGESTSKPTVTLHRPGREICLRDRPGLPGLMDTEHEMKIEPLGPEQARFIHWQRTSGLLSPIMGGWNNDKLRGQLEAMNRALKERVEHGTASVAETQRHQQAPARSESAARGRAVGQPA